MNSKPAFMETLQTIFKQVPHLSCGECWGECCVSPTMTPPEFINLIKHSYVLFGAEEFYQKIQAPAALHSLWEGNLLCRFQNKHNGNCEIYEGRALACRLHGHDALKFSEVQDMVFCEKKPDEKGLLTNELLNHMIDTISELATQKPLEYEVPWFFMSLNLDSWLDFYFMPEISLGRGYLEKLNFWMFQQLKIRMIDNYQPLTQLREKLEVIEKGYHCIQDEDWDLAEWHFSSSTTEFVSVGSYFQKEARDILEWIAQKRTEE